MSAKRKKSVLRPKNEIAVSRPLGWSREAISRARISDRRGGVPPRGQTRARTREVIR